MIDYQLQPGTKIRCLKGTDFMTKGKVYITLPYRKGYWYEESDNVFWFIDDDGDEMYSFPSHKEFEVVG